MSNCQRPSRSSSWRSTARNWSGRPRTLATHSVSRCDRTWRCRSWASSARLEVQRPEVLPKSPMAEALGYALKNWAEPGRYTEADFLAIDNNVAERR